MDMNTARYLVILDLRRNFSKDELTDDECIKSVQNGIALTSSGPGWVQLENFDNLDDGDDLTEAYKLVLSDDIMLEHANQDASRGDSAELAAIQAVRERHGIDSPLTDAEVVRTTRDRVKALERCVDATAELLDEFNRELDRERVRLVDLLRSRQHVELT